MSAWLCGNLTLSCVVDVIKSEEFKWNYDPADWSYKSKEELINYLSDLNTQSLNCRYGESPTHILEDRHYCPTNVSEAQKHKSVACYNYQTCECWHIEELPIFVALENWVSDNREKFEAEWDQCHWDLDNPHF